MSSPVNNNRLVPAATRTVAILRLLGKSHSPLSLKEISSELDIIPSTCLHILRVLVAESLVTLDASSKRYQLGIGVLSLARSAIAKDAMIGFIRGEVETLSARFGLTAVATRIIDSRCISVAVSIPPNVFAISPDVGARYPVSMSVTGRCYAAFGNVDRNKVYKDLVKRKWAKVPEFEEWSAEVDDTIRNGYAVDRENYILGVTLVGAPIFDSAGDMTHVLALVAISQAADQVGIDTIGRALVKSASNAHAEHSEPR